MQVRQDQGVQPGAEEPDWELIEKLEEIASKDEVVLPDVPEAPDLDAVAAQPLEESASSESLPDSDAESSSEDEKPTDESSTKENSTDKGPSSTETDQAPSWDLEDGEDLWGGAAWEEE